MPMQRVLHAHVLIKKPHVHTSRHVISGTCTRPSPSLFLHGCEIKAGVGRTGNEASVLYLHIPSELIN